MTMVFHGPRGNSVGTNRARPFRTRARGRRSYNHRGQGRGSRGSSHGGHDEGLRITLRNTDNSFDRRDSLDSHDRVSDRNEAYDYQKDNYKEESFSFSDDRRSQKSHDSRDSPPRKKPHLESDAPDSESLRITVGNDLFEGRQTVERWKDRRDERGRQVERNLDRDSARDSYNDPNAKWSGKEERTGSCSEDRIKDKMWVRERSHSTRTFEHSRPGYSRGADNEPLRGGPRGRGGGQYGLNERHYVHNRDSERDSHRRRSISNSPEYPRSRSRDRQNLTRERHSRTRDKSFSPNKQIFNRGRRSRNRSTSRGRFEKRSYSRGKRSHSRGRSFSPSRRRSSRERSLSLERRSHSRGRSLSRGRRYSRSRSRSYSPKRRSFSRSLSGGLRSRSRSLDGRSSSSDSFSDLSGRPGRRRSISRPLSPITKHEAREPLAEKIDYGEVKSSTQLLSDISSSSSSITNEDQNQNAELTEKQFEEEMFHRLKTELSAKYDDPKEREEHIAKHIREMAKLSPSLFRQFMSKNAGNLAALAFASADEQINETVVPDPIASHSSPSESSKPLRSILKTKSSSLSPVRHSEDEISPSAHEPLSHLEKVIHSLRKGSFSAEKEMLTSEQTGALKQLSSYMDIEDEEEFLYGDEEKKTKGMPGTDSAVPFWSAQRFEENASQPQSALDIIKSKLKRPEARNDILENLTKTKTEEVKIPAVSDPFEEKEKSYEQWRASVFQKVKEDRISEDQSAQSKMSEKAESSNLSSTVENILKSIGFNFDLSRRMQELARQKKEQESAESLAINQTASFLGTSTLASSFKSDVFSKDSKSTLKEDVANLVEEVRLATKLAQDKARRASLMEERHMKKGVASNMLSSSENDLSKEKDRIVEIKEKSLHSRGREHTDSEMSDLFNAPMTPSDSYAPTYQGYGYQPYYSDTQQLDYGYENYGYYSSVGNFGPDYEDPHQSKPNPVRTSNLISLAGDTSLKTGEMKKELSGNLKLLTPAEDRLIQQEKKQIGDVKNRSESIAVVKKKTEGRSDESEKSGLCYSRRIVLPPKEKGKHSPGTPSAQSSFRRDVQKRAPSPVASPKQTKHFRQLSPKSDGLSGDKKVAKTQETVNESKKLNKLKEMSKEHTEKPISKVLSTAKDKALQLKQKEDGKRKLVILERELAALKQQHNELLRKRRRQKDGHRDPLLAENTKLQEEISAQIKLLRSGEEPQKSHSHHQKKLPSVPERVKKDNEKPDVKTQDEKKMEKMPKVHYEYFDPGNHWCRLCNIVCGHMFDYFKHLESKKHQQRLDPFERPWLLEALRKSESTVKQGAAQVLPVKGHMISSHRLRQPSVDANCTPIKSIMFS